MAQVSIRKSIITSVLIIAGMFGIFSAPALAVSTTEDELETSAGFAVVVPEVNSLEISLSSTNLVLDLTPQPDAAAFDTTDLVIKVGTSNITGYALSMQATNSSLSSASGETIPAIGSTIASADFATSGASINKWAYKTTGNYEVVTTDTAPLNSNTTPTNEDTTTVTFAAKVDATQPAGSYTAVLKFVAVTNPVPYHTITWDYNNSIVSTVETTAVIDATAVKLPKDPQSPNETFYTAFKEWNTRPDGTGDTVTRSFIPEADTTFYAVWQFADDTLQATTPTNCSGTKYDARDGSAYQVAVLADGRCWLLDNLNLSGPRTIKAGDSNSEIRPASELNPSANGAEINAFVLPSSTATWGVNGDSNAFYVYPYTFDEIKNETNAYGTSGNESHVGVYYNYCAISAGTYCYYSGFGSSGAIHDICPSGWKLPTGGEGGEALNLYQKYNSDATTFLNNLHATLSGMYQEDQAAGRASGGWMHSATAGTHTANTYTLLYGPNYLYQDGLYTGLRAYGYTARCILK